VFAVAIALSAMGLQTATTALAADLTIIELRHRTADELLPVLRPLAADASISGVDYKLLVRGNAADVARLREAVAVMDRAARQLRVSVRYLNNPSSQETQLGVSRDGVRAGATIATADDASVSSVQVSEGSSAFIAEGQSVPTITGVLATRGRVDGAAIGYRELTTGFNVTPRVNGDRAYVEVVTHQQRQDRGPNASIQNAGTTLSGPLGAWIEIGGVTTTTSGNSLRLGSGASTRTSTQSDRRVIEVKVEALE
jgi:type II secretory pathway component GspD/PulD (secretin)